MSVMPSVAPGDLAISTSSGPEAFVTVSSMEKSVVRLCHSACTVLKQQRQSAVYLEQYVCIPVVCHVLGCTETKSFPLGSIKYYSILFCSVLLYSILFYSSSKV